MSTQANEAIAAPVAASASAGPAGTIAPRPAPTVHIVVEPLPSAPRPHLLTALGMLFLVFAAGVTLAYLLYNPVRDTPASTDRSASAPRTRDALTYDLAKRPTAEIRGAWRQKAPAEAPSEVLPSFTREPQLVEPPAAAPTPRVTGAPQPLPQPAHPAESTAPQRTATPAPEAMAVAPTVTARPPVAPAAPQPVADPLQTEPTTPADLPVVVDTPSAASTPADVASRSKDAPPEDSHSTQSAAPEDAAAGQITAPTVEVGAEPLGRAEPPRVETGSIPAAARTPAPPTVAPARNRKLADGRGKDQRRVRKPRGKVAKINRSQPSSPRTSLDAPSSDVYERTFGGFARGRP